MAITGGALMLLSGAGALYMLAAAWVLRRYFAAPPDAPMRDEGVTLLKPLHGAEPRLADNLSTFLVQKHRGSVQMLCGVQRADDPAIGVVERIAGAELVLDPASHGASGKVSNLVNIAAHARHEVIVLSDSDIAVAPDYLARLLAALDAPGVGAVTCLYAGRGDAGFWSRVAAAGLNWQFLPGAVFGVALGMARPCMGSTIALRRETLDAIGGFARFADVLADDHAIGAAVEELGLTVAVPPMLVVHACDETSLAALWRHELRWAATVRGLVPEAAYAASVIGYPLPLALLAIPFAPGLATPVAAFALAARLFTAWTADRIAGARPASYLLIPLRDCLGFAIFVASFLARSVDWRGTRLHMAGNGRVETQVEKLTS
ncbi:MAG: bacteriohopanetetrol glucosamine biosynthesis glycosyltransferase HpnI [Sphingomonas bacterium]